MFTKLTRKCLFGIVNYSGHPDFTRCRSVLQDGESAPHSEHLKLNKPVLAAVGGLSQFHSVSCPSPAHQSSHTYFEMTRKCRPTVKAQLLSDQHVNAIPT